MVFDFIRVGSVPLRSDRHRLYGTLPTGGVTIDTGAGAHPAARLVCIFDRKKQYLEAAKWSRPDGSFDFSGLPEYPPRALLVVGYDNENLAAPETVLNAVCQDFASQDAPHPLVPPAPETP